MRVLTWNLFHGRSVPVAGQALAEEFSERLASWAWDVALLQEVPPWWTAPLAARAGAEHRSALTSRNSALLLRRAFAERWPDLLKSNGGGANAILARGAILEHRAVRLRSRPERRVAQLVRLQDGTVVANFHASTRVELAEAELQRLWELASSWAAGAPLLVGGDLNLRSPRAPRREVLHLAARDVDHLFAYGLEAVGEPELLARGVVVRGREVQLSDHPPLAIDVKQP